MSVSGEGVSKRGQATWGRVFTDRPLLAVGTQVNRTYIVVNVADVVAQSGRLQINEWLAAIGDLQLAVAGGELLVDNGVHRGGPLLLENRDG